MDASCFVGLGVGCSCCLYPDNPDWKRRFRLLVCVGHDTCSNAFVVGCAPFLLGFPGKSKIVQKFKHIGLDYFSRVYRNKEGAWVEPRRATLTLLMLTSTFNLQLSTFNFQLSHAHAHFNLQLSHAHFKVDIWEFMEKEWEAELNWVHVQIMYCMVHHVVAVYLMCSRTFMSCWQ